MKSKIAKKIVAISFIFTFICSFSNPIFAELIKSDEDGVAYDLFNNADSIFLKNCTIDSGTVTLENKSYILEYDYNTKPNNIEAWENDDPFLVPGGDIATILSSITNPALLGKYEFIGYNSIKSIDNNAYETESIAVVSINYVYHPLHLFKFQIDEKVGQLQGSQFDVGWWSGPYDEDANLEEIRMYLWSYGDLLSRWNFIDRLNYSMEDINAPNGFIYSREDVSKYISSEGEIYILIVGKPLENIDPIAPAILATDYVKIEIPIDEGFKTNGHIISDPITPDPDNFNGWDKIIWEGSIPTDETYIKIKVLDKDGNVINSLDGNSQGFMNSPVDISSLGKSIPTIKLQAIFHTDLFKVTPRLFNWGVLWHSTEGFFDSFTSDFRIGEGLGVKIEDNNIEIDNYYTEWPIFGKNPSNTRSYIGPELDYKVNQTYWRTDINENIGGWFKSPIMCDGKVFISANNSKIYAFNLTFDKTFGSLKEYGPCDISDEEYEVETTFAADNGYLIVATSKLNSRANKIYALNTSDLSDKLWTYPPKDNNENGFAKTICFSAPPTISNGKVYITSWSGEHATQPIFNYIMSRLNEFTNHILGINNKLFILDLASGYEIINPIILPAASLSTPAVDEGMIYVGCENYGGPSLFAIEESSGDLIWNASVGTIGRASPVVVNGNDGKMVIVLAREQSIFSNQGTDKVIALNAETGEMLWNFTIGNESALFRRNWLQTYEFNHVKATEPPAATPAYYNNMIYVMASDSTVYAIDVNTGEEVWKFTVYQSVVSEYHSCSPVVVDDLVYVISQDAKLFALNAMNGKIVIEHPIEYESYVLTSYAYASPIVVDGIAIISFMDWRWREENIYFGHLITLGELEKNMKGRLYSAPIRIQNGNWWDKFYADYSNTTENDITFSILDGKGNTMLSGLDGDDNILSTSYKINSNVIQLCAELSILNETGDSPVLRSWGVTWSPETTSPQFSANSFQPDLNGWIQNNTPICSIEVRDDEPGLNKDEAYYRLTYVSDQQSNWIKAECSGPMGSRLFETITADLTKLPFEPDVLKRIEFRIEDLAGNSAKFKLGADFKIDNVSPISSIENGFDPTYNTPVNIEVYAEDPADTYGNISGIESIGIYYRLVGDDEWILYDTAKNLFNWKFSPSFSGEFEICTIATDNAGNVEDFPTIAPATFIYDAIKPEIPIFGELVFNWIPDFDIIFEDDFRLQTVEYRLDYNANWTKINKEDINAKNYTASWSLSEEWEKLEENTSYSLYFRLTDFVGNQNETLSRDALKFSINTIPQGVKVTLDLSDFDEKGKESYIISANIPDDELIEYVTLHYSYSSNGEDYSGFMQYGEGLIAPYEWVFKPSDGSGYYRFIVRIWDAGGNFNTSPIKEVTLTMMPVTLIIVLILLFIIFIIISIIVLKKIKVMQG